MTGNRLGAETSPYLLQHAANPVHWRPWGPEALAEARAGDKPLLLSIGYAACHWCHVMAHESFEDEATAALMNELFVSVKVDREERPDLDAIYQQALALMGERGGWPLTMFCTPAGEPFWGGTYFPPEARWGRPAFSELLRGAAHAYRTQRDKVAANVQEIRAALAELARPRRGVFAPERLDAVAVAAARSFDPVAGGLAGAPKFPQAPLLHLLWRAARRRRDDGMRELVLVALDRMAQGGIYDHLGGGFARYAVDEAWLVPHFEKMLYDNALLIELYSLAWRATRRPLYAARVAETIGWLLREMTSPDGPAFAAAEDADSEGEEGKFYVWSAGELRRRLGADYALFARVYDVAEDGNWEGRTILNRLRDLALADDATEATLARCRAILFEARRARVPPLRDDKVLADWNGLAIAALVEAGRAFARPEWIAAARAAFAFVLERMRPDGRLRHAYRAGRARHPATLDDHAMLARAALLLHEATSDPAALDAARELVAALDARFWDAAEGGYFFTADDAEDLLARTKSGFDQATPAGNGVMVEVLARLAPLTGDAGYRRRALAILEAFGGDMERGGPGAATLVNAGAFLDAALEIVVVGDAADPARAALLATALAADVPDRIALAVAPGAALPPGHPAEGKGLVKGAAAVYLCRTGTCSPPLTDPISLAAELARS